MVFLYETTTYWCYRNVGTSVNNHHRLTFHHNMLQRTKHKHLNGLSELCRWWTWLLALCQWHNPDWPPDRQSIWKSVEMFGFFRKCINNSTNKRHKISTCRDCPWRKMSQTYYLEKVKEKKWYENTRKESGHDESRTWDLGYWSHHALSLHQPLHSLPTTKYLLYVYPKFLHRPLELRNKGNPDPNLNLNLP